jgi:hypothetical protein
MAAKAASTVVNGSRSAEGDEVLSIGVAHWRSGLEVVATLSNLTATASLWLSGITKASNRGGCRRHRQEHRGLNPLGGLASDTCPLTYDDTKAAKRWRGRPAAHRPVVAMSSSG